MAAGPPDGDLVSKVMFGQHTYAAKDFWTHRDQYNSGIYEQVLYERQ